MKVYNNSEFNINDVNKEVIVHGWVSKKRNLGGLIFIDLRDYTGVTQVVVHNEALLKGVSKETVLSVHGTVTKRDENTVNPKIETGLVELVADDLKVLGTCTRELPFEIGSNDTNENLRLKHRFLDLRNPALHNNILLRSKVIGHMRKLMEERGFLDIQTPILTTSSPEGARDFLVPSRKHPGKFYALPQAPQQFKQLLMTSGFDRYFQIAPCFRDEDARGDRSPGEFYQLDMEMAFADQEDVFEFRRLVKDRTKEQIEAQVKALEDAIKGLEEKETTPVEVDYACTQSVFKAKVVDINGNPMTGVTFTAVIDGIAEQSITSNVDGIITYYVYGSKAWWHCFNFALTSTRKGLCHFIPMFKHLTEGIRYMQRTKA